MHSRIILTGIAVALLAVAACAQLVDGRATPVQDTTSSTSRAATTASNDDASLQGVDPCTLISRGEVENVTGRLRKGPTRDDVGTARSCGFATEDGTYAIDIRENVGLAGVQAAGEVIDLVVGKHQAKKFLGSAGSCFVALGVTESSRVDVAVNSSSSDEEPCPLASAVAELVEPKLP